MSVVLKDTNPVKTIFGYASVRDEKGEEMHKSKGNAIWFDDAVEKVGADPMRWLYMRQNPAENLGFGYGVIEETKRKLMTLYNSFVFFSTYIKKEELSEKLLATKSKNILDKWILSRMTYLMSGVGVALDNYSVGSYILCAEDFFINDFSLWYIRRSRKRFHEDNPDRKEAISAFYYVLLNLTKVLAPVMPFFAEGMYLSLRTSDMPESVHLCDWPKAKKTLWNPILGQKMNEARLIVGLALAERAAKGIKVKQPLASLKIKNLKSKIKNDGELLDLIKDEVNIKEIIFDGKILGEVELDTNITEELEGERILREIVRLAQAQRKEQNLVPQDKIFVELSLPKREKLLVEKNKEFLLKELRATEIFTKEQTGESSVKISLIK